MKRYKKAVVITIAIVFALLGILGLGRLSFSIFKDNLESKIFPLKDPISVINNEYKRKQGVIIDWVFDPNNKNQLAGWADYIFVAEVTEVVGTGYMEVEMYDGFRFDSTPFTRYKIRVLENLKGQLTTKEDIPLTKDDGVEFFGKKVSFLEGDMLPDVGECYIFLCRCDEDGELVIGQYSSHNDIYICKADEYTGREEVIAVYRDDVKNMDESVRLGENSKSKYDIS